MCSKDETEFTHYICLERKVSGEKHKSLWLYQLFRKTIMNNILFPETSGIINNIVKFTIEILKFPQTGYNSHFCNITQGEKN